MSKKVASIDKSCVACGCCVKVCPRSALFVHKGVCAAVDESRCVACTKCVATCPAGVISMMLRDVDAA